MKPRIARGDAVEDLLAKAAQRPGDYRRVIVCTAFLDQLGVRLLERIIRGSTRRGTQIVSCLGPSAYESATPLIRDRSRLVRNLHSKVYALEGRRRADDDLIVTSANLTDSGLRRNHETGIRLRGSSPGVRRIIRQLRRLVERRTKNQNRSNKKQGPYATKTTYPSKNGVTQ